MEAKIPKGICSFSEIATLYYRNVSKYHATKRLKNAIENCPPLIKKLQETGYHKKTKELTPAQKKLIFESLGPPLE